MYGTVLLGLLSAIVVATLFFTIKSRKRVGRTEAEREQQIAALLASARADAANTQMSRQSAPSERPATPEKTAIPQLPPQRDVRYLLDEQEQLFYRRLLEAVPALLVFPKVAVTRVLDMQRFRKDGPSPLAEMNLDFVICRPEDMSILAAIEFAVDAQSIATEKKRIALDQSGLPLVVLGYGELPDVSGLRKSLAPHLAARRRG